MKVDPLPSPEELKERRKPKFVVDVNQVSPKDELRIRQWATTLIKKHESKLNYIQWKDRDIITSGTVDPEDIDIKGIYPFADLHWIIYRANTNFNVMLLSKGTMLFVSSFAKI